MRGKLVGLVFGTLVAYTAAAGAAPDIELSVVNRFRLLAGEAEEGRYHDELETRLLCGDGKRRAQHKTMCRNRTLRQRLAVNFRTLWIPRENRYDTALIHNLDRLVHLAAEGLVSSQTARCQWTVNGELLVGQHNCAKAELHVRLNAQRIADVRVAVEVEAADGTKVSIPERTIRVRDVVIVTIGDSFLSGEGNPHIPYRVFAGDTDRGRSGRKAEWLDLRCHRSLFTSSAIAAARLANEVKTQSVTFVPLACSGARIIEGVLGPYHGIETNIQAAWVDDGFEPVRDDLYFPGRKLPSQLSALYRSLCPSGVSGSDEGCEGRHVKPDLILFSSGGNEIGFGETVVSLASGGVADSHKLPTLLAKLPELYEKFDKAITKVGARQIFALAYLDPTQRYVRRSGKRVLDYCSDKGAKIKGRSFVPRFATLLGYGVTARGSQSAQKQVLIPLNEALADASTAHHWRMLSLSEEVQRGHGYCSLDAAWFWTFGSSYKFQFVTGIDKDEDNNNRKIGSVPTGSMHPNIFGHSQIADRIYDEFKSVGLSP